MAEYMYRKGVKIDPHSYRAHINWIVYLSEHGKYKIPLPTARALSGDDRINLSYYIFVSIVLHIPTFVPDIVFEKFDFFTFRNWVLCNSKTLQLFCYTFNTKKCQKTKYKEEKSDKDSVWSH